MKQFFYFVLFLFATGCAAPAQNIYASPAGTATVQITRMPTATTTPTLTPTFHPYPTSTLDVTAQARLLTPSPTTLPGYPTPELPRSYSPLVLVSEEYIGDFVLRVWKAAGDFSSYSTVTLVRNDKLLETINGIVGWEIKDVTGDESPEIILDITSGGSMCMGGTVVYEVGREHKKILANDGCSGRFENLDDDAALEYVSYSTSYSLGCCVACTPFTMVVYDYYDVQGYMASSPKFSYLYDESIADKTIYLESGEWNPKYANSYCPVAGLALDYIYSGRPEKGWKIISKYYSGDEGLALKKKVKEVLSEDSAYVSEEKFKPELLKSLRLNPDNADDVALSLTFSPDGKILALSTLHGNIQLWNTISWNLLVQFRGDDIQIGKVEFSPDGRRLIFVQNNSLYVYDIHSMKKERLFTTQYFSSGNCADFSPNGKLVLFCTGGTVYLLDSFTGKKVAAFKHNMFAVRSKFSPDGKILAVGLENYMGDDLYLWDLSTNKLIMHANPYPYSLAFDPEGTVLAVLEPSYSDGMKPVVKIRNANSGEWVRTFSVECISAFSFRPDGHAIVCGGQKKELQIYDVLTGDVLYALSGHEDNVSNVVYSPDGKLLASVDHSGGLLIWRVP